MTNQTNFSVSFSFACLSPRQFVSINKNPDLTN